MSSQEVSPSFKPNQIIPMTNSNNQNNNRLDRIEAIVESLARSAQAIADDHEERIQTIEDTIVRLDDTVARLTRIEEAQNRMLSNMDEDRPTVLRRLMAIENKVDTLIERDSN